MYDKEKQIIMSILKLILTAVFAVSTIIPAFAQAEPERKDNEVVWTETDGVTIPLPPKAHPRLYLRDANVPELREKMKTPEGKAILKKIKKAEKNQKKRLQSGRKCAIINAFGKRRTISSDG